MVVSLSTEFCCEFSVRTNILGEGYCLPLELGNSDLILGVQWLKKFGDVVTNWKTQVMEYKVEGQLIHLKGNPTLAQSRVSLQAMIRSLEREG